jgi:hypothetical protein
MPKLTSLFARTRLVNLAVLLGICWPAVPAQAQLARTFVSAAVGNDANDCNRLTPCRTFQTAHDKTFDQGEITVLDPGGYGAVTITKSIAIINDGVGEAGVLVSGGATGITVNASPAGYVSLRGITIQGIGFGGGNGLLLNSGFSLSVSNCSIRNLTGTAIDFRPSGNGRLSVFNTLVADNGGQGILVFPSGFGAVRVAVDRTAVTNNSSNGMSFAGGNSTGTINATVSDSVSSNNSDTGVIIGTAVGKAPTTVMVVRSMLSNNSTSAVGAAGVGARLVFGQSAVSGNGAVVGLGGGAVVQSFGDNYIAGNFDGDPAPPVITTK